MDQPEGAETMIKSILEPLLRRGLIAFFPLAGMLAAPQWARADAGAEFTVVTPPGGLDESVRRVYSITRGEMDYMGVAKLEFFEIDDARSSLDIIRGLIAKISPAGEVSLDSWCKEQPAPASTGSNACARQLLKKHVMRRYSAFAKSMISALDPESTDFNALSKDCVAMADAPAAWLGDDYLEVTVTSDYYSTDVMISLMMSRDLKRAILAFYDFGA
jgi:hypothetical protein